VVKVNNKVKQLIYKQIYKYAEIYKSWPSSTLHVIKFAFQEFQNRIYCRCKTAKILSSAFWNVSNYWPIRHKMALCQYSELVGGPCGLSLENRSSTQCVTIGECDKNVKGHLNYQPRSQGFSLFVIGKAGKGPGTGRSHDFQHPDIVGVINYN
jgi:hypothetical protein